jgi:hypothetical protein
MVVDFPICEYDLEYWVEELNEVIPLEIDGITPEGSDELVKHEFVPGSVRVDQIIDQEEFFRTHLCYLAISYNVIISRMADYAISVRQETWGGIIPVLLKDEGDISCDMDLTDVNFFMSNAPMDVFI